MQFEYLEILFYIMAAIFLIGSSFRIMKEYERAVIFRLGKYLKTKGPGLIFIIPLIDKPRKAAQTLAEAGKILADNPQGLQLRYLETLRYLSVQKGSTIIFPFPLDMLGSFTEGIKKGIQKDIHILEFLKDARGVQISQYAEEDAGSSGLRA